MAVGRALPSRRYRRWRAQAISLSFYRVVTVGLQQTDAARVEVLVHWGEPHKGVITTMQWKPDNTNSGHMDPRGRLLPTQLGRMRSFSLDASAIICPTQLEPTMELQHDGGHLAGVLDHLRDYNPEKFEALNEELGRWLPEFDRVLFNTLSVGHRSFMLRTRQGHHAIPASDLSQGTLFALTLLTLAYLPDPPPLVCLEGLQGHPSTPPTARPGCSRPAELPRKLRRNASACTSPGDHALTILSRPL